MHPPVLDQGDYFWDRQCQLQSFFGFGCRSAESPHGNLFVDLISFSQLRLSFQ
jgi:hypothetical protein